MFHRVGDDASDLFYGLGKVGVTHRGPVPASVVGGVPARADAREHIAGAASGCRKLRVTMPGDYDAAAPPVDARLHDPDRAARRVDAKPVSGDCLVEQYGVLAVGPTLAGEARG